MKPLPMALGSRVCRAEKDGEFTQVCSTRGFLDRVLSYLELSVRDAGIRGEHVGREERPFASPSP